jgi:tetratricopeptide (TPR) repeat protein
LDSRTAAAVIPAKAGMQQPLESNGLGGNEPTRVLDFQAQWLAAELALRQEQFDQAAAVYERLLQSQPQCAPALWNHALALAYAHPGGALSGVAGALPAAPSLAAGRLLLAVTRVLNGDMAGAEVELTTVAAQGADLKVNARGAVAGTAQSTSPQSRDRLPATDENVKGAKARDVLWARAMVAWGSGKPREARQSLARLAELQPESAAVWFELGGVALDEARASSRRLSDVAPDSVWNRRLQAEAVQTRYPGLARNLREGGLEASKESAERQTQEDSPFGANESPRELYLQTRAALRVSEMAYGRASASPRFQAYLHAMRALAAEQEDDEAAAMREYNIGLAQDPQCALLHAGLGHVYRRRMDLPAAERELDQAWRLDPSDPLVAFELGDTEQRLGKTQPALELLNQALELDASLLVARWSRAKAYLTLGDNERALADLEAAAPADSSGELQWQLARLYRKLGRTDLAAQAEKRSEEQRIAAARRLETRSGKQ